MAQAAGYVIHDLQGLIDNSDFVTAGEGAVLWVLTIAVEALHNC